MSFNSRHDWLQVSNTDAVFCCRKESETFHSLTLISPQIQFRIIVILTFIGLTALFDSAIFADLTIDNYGDGEDEEILANCSTLGASRYASEFEAHSRVFPFLLILYVLKLKLKLKPTSICPPVQLKVLLRCGCYSQKVCCAALNFTKFDCFHVIAVTECDHLHNLKFQKCCCSCCLSKAC